MKSNFGKIKDPFKKVFKPIGAVKTGCFGCEGCKYEYYGFSAEPCVRCSHNIRNKNISAKNFYEKK